MSRSDKVLQRILNGQADRNIDFYELIGLLMKLGFELRIKGSHHILSMINVEEIINLQPKNGLAKPYQVKQVRDLIIKYELRFESDERN